jgi:hypothetical protein
MVVKAKAYFYKGELTVICPNCLARLTLPGRAENTIACKECGNPFEIAIPDVREVESEPLHGVFAG